MGQFFSALLSLAANLVVLFAFGWMARALLGAREVTWRRLILASVAGFGLGDAVAVLLRIDELSDLQTVDLSGQRGVAFPFQMVATMGAIVVLEMLFSRPRPRDASPGSARSGPFASPSG